MKECFVVTSSIQTSNIPLTYSSNRSAFSSNERYRQTIYTINSIISQKPEATIYIFDSSYEYSEYAKFFSYFPRVTFIPLKEISEKNQKLVNTHRHKSYCECLLLDTFFDYFKQDLKEFDFFYKATGRYVYEFNNYPVSTEKIYFKYPNEFPWEDSWNEYFKLVDYRAAERHNVFKQYCTVLYGFGNCNIKLMQDYWKSVLEIVTKEDHIQYDVECLMYHLTRPQKNLIEHAEWVVTGFEGASGRLLRY